MALESKSLRFFVKVADHGSLSKAAKSLNMVQPALSHQIGNLERELGVSLFSRKAHGVVLTEAGQSLMPYAVSALRLLDEAQQEIERQTDNVAGTVRIGFSGSAGILMIPVLLKAARQRFPEIRLQIIENYSATLLEWVKTDRVDMAVTVAQTVTGGAGRKTVPLVVEPLYLVGTPATMSQIEETIRFSEIFDNPLVLTAPGNSMRMALEKTALECGFAIEPLAEVTGLAALKAAIASGVCNTVLSKCAVVEECLQEIFVARRIVEPDIQRTMVLDYHKRNPIRQSEVVVRDLVIELLTGLVENGTIMGEVLTGE
jgi:LysR family transcriptional regulator, nitrogen assimilation regulatory protein